MTSQIMPVFASFAAVIRVVAQCSPQLCLGGALPDETKGSFSIKDAATAAKTSLLNEFAFFQTLSRLFQFLLNVKCRRISLELISWGPHSRLVYVLQTLLIFWGGRPKKIRRVCMEFSKHNWATISETICPKWSFLASRPLGHCSFRIS